MTATDTKSNRSSSKSFSYIKFILIGLVIAALSWLTAIIGCGNYISLNPKLYAKTFMAWRTKGGDSVLFEGRYKGYSKNDYPSSKEFERFLSLAQLEDALLITGNYPLHAPRGPEKLFTLIDEERAVEDLWEVEFNVKCRLEGKMNEKEVEEFREKAKDAMNKRKVYDQEFKSKYFVTNPKIKAEEVKKFFTIKGKDSVWKKACGPFITILNNLVSKKKDYGYRNGKVSDSLYKDIKAFMKPLGYDADDYKSKINGFFMNMATVKATPFETFLYSRLFNLYTFLTINHKFDYKTEIPENEKKKTDEKYSLERAGIFAQIFAKVYEEEYNYELENPTFKERLSKWFGTSQDTSDVANQDDNIKSSLTTAKSNLKAVEGA